MESLGLCYYIVVLQYKNPLQFYTRNSHLFYNRIVNGNVIASKGCNYEMCSVNNVPNVFFQSLSVTFLSFSFISSWEINLIRNVLYISVVSGKSMQQNSLTFFYLTHISLQLACLIDLTEKSQTTGLEPDKAIHLATYQDTRHNLSIASPALKESQVLK